MKIPKLPSTYCLVLLWAAGGLGMYGCRNTTALKRGSSTGGAAGLVTSQVGGSAGSTPAGSSGGAGTAGSGAKQCRAEAQAASPTVSKNCVVSARNVDPVFTCGQADCAVRKALDLTCDTLPHSGSLSATAHGSALFSITNNSKDNSSAAHLMTVTENGSRVDDVSELNNGAISWFSVLETAMSSSSSGRCWVFAREGTSLIAAHETDTRWVRSSISLKPNSGAYLSARMVDDNLGYLTYGIDADGYAPHLVTWDGSCWTDLALADRGTPASTVVAVDDNKQPWVAWTSGNDSLYLRSPNGDTQDLLSNLTGDAHAPTTVGTPRLLPGGVDGSSAFPLVAASTSDGIRLFSRKATDPGWRFAGLPEPGTTGTIGQGCPMGPTSDDCNQDPCLGVTTCNAQVNAPGSGFDLVRTQSGRTFAARIVYSSQGTYALEKVWRGLEFPTCYCGWTETSGTGTADLILMHVTEAEPILSHFRFDMGGATSDTSRDLIMTARGDTLVVAAQLGGSRVPTLTYVEIDSSRLP
jgi:hypothetical protein